jgi:hypothetical protein
VSQSSHRPALALALVLCALKGVAAAWVTPAFQTPDEYGHYDYVLYLSHITWGEFLRGNVARPQAYHDITTDELWAVTQASGTESHLRGQGLRRPLPTLGMQVAFASAFVPTDSHGSLARKTIVPAQFNYPMLYYGGMALVVKAVRMTTPNPVIAYYTARTVSLGLLLLTVYFTWATARVVFAEHGGGGNTCNALRGTTATAHPSWNLCPVRHADGTPHYHVQRVRSALRLRTVG